MHHVLSCYNMAGFFRCCFMCTGQVSWHSPAGYYDNDTSLTYNVWVWSELALGTPPQLDLPCCSANFTSLIDVPYVFAVNGTNAAGSGPPAVSLPAVPGAGVPVPPAAVRASSPAANVANVTWVVNATDDGGSPITGYTVQSNASAYGVVPVSVGSGNSTAWFFGIPLNVSIAFMVVARNARGAGLPSPLTPAVVSVADRPSPPLGVQAVTQPSSSACPNGTAPVAVSWLPPVFTGGTLVTITQYTLFRAGSSGGSLAPITSTVSLSVTYCAVTNVAVAFTVTATNSWGRSSDFSVESKAIIPLQGVPPAPVVTSVVIADLPPGVTVSW